MGETASQAENTELLTQLSIALNGIDNEKNAFKVLAQHAKYIVDSERVSITLLNADKTKFDVFALDGLEGTIPLNVSLPYKGTILGKSVQDDQLTIEPDTAVSEFLDSQSLNQAGILSTIMSPLKIADETIGTLNFGFTTTYTENQPLILLIQQMTLMFNQTLTKSRYLANSRKQVLQLKTVSDVSTRVSSIQDINELTKSVVDLTKERFDLYHSHIYLLNDIGNKLVLNAGAGEIGDHMVAEGREIAYSTEQSLVARAARTKQVVIVNDVYEDTGFLPHPLLPNTASEMAIPIATGQQLFGVLDVQAKTADFFDTLDAEVFMSLTSQVAVAMQNAKNIY